MENTIYTGRLLRCISLQEKHIRAWNDDFVINEVYKEVKQNGNNYTTWYLEGERKQPHGNMYVDKNCFKLLNRKN